MSLRFSTVSRARRREEAWGSLTIPSLRHVVVVFAAATIGVFAALGVLVFIGALLAAGIGGISVFEADNLERLAASTVITAIALVFLAFFCGGWAYGVLRGTATRGEPGRIRYGESHAYAPTRRVTTGLDRGTAIMNGEARRLQTREYRSESRVKRSWKRLAGVDLASGSFDELAGRIR